MSAHHPSQTTPDLPPPVTFFSIEQDTPARSFWASLARLLFTLASAARRKGEPQR
jgi:hypothetical protein